MTTPWTLTIDCTDAVRCAAFWRTALGYEDAPPPAGFASWEDWFDACEVPLAERGDGAALVDPTGAAPRISFLRVPEPKSVKNRLHLDLQVSGGRAVPSEVRRARITGEVARLVDAGAQVISEHRIGEDLDHVVMADPEGNDFCVV